MKVTLFEGTQVGAVTLKNRIVMAPMTRTRSTQPGDIPNDLMATYYLQRASAGLIISEATQICELGKAKVAMSGIYTPDQIAGWKKVTAAVHQKGGKMFAQLWHCGRVTHNANTGGLQPVGPSALLAKGVDILITNAKGKPELVAADMPRAMTHDDIKKVVGEFKQAAQNALDAGFDGVELHAGNGYLINQFIDSVTNERTDEYGGSLENRMRFLSECVDAAVSVVGAGKVGVCISPFGTKNDTFDQHPCVTYLAVARTLKHKEVAYMHVVEQVGFGAGEAEEFRKSMRKAFESTIISTGDYDYSKGTAAVQSGYADCIGFGRLYIANPDLVERMQHNYPMAAPDSSTFYQGRAVGYIDYPCYSATDSPAVAAGVTNAANHAAVLVDAATVARAIDLFAVSNKVTTTIVVAT